MDLVVRLSLETLEFTTSHQVLLNSIFFKTWMFSSLNAHVVPKVTFEQLLKDKSAEICFSCGC